MKGYCTEFNHDVTDFSCHDCFHLDGLGACEYYEPKPEEVNADEQISSVVGTSSSTTELLHCPFCGAKGIVDKVDHGINDYYYRIKCDSDYEHKLDWWEDTENEAIAVWNMRA